MRFGGRGGIECIGLLRRQRFTVLVDEPTRFKLIAKIAQAFFDLSVECLLVDRRQQVGLT